MIDAPRKLDIGAGAWEDDNGYLRLDIVRHFSPEVQGDARALPFKDESLHAVRCWHMLEHLPPMTLILDWDQRSVEYRNTRIEVMNEIWRVLKPDGKLWIEVPLFPTEDAINDPTHLGWFSPGTFDYFTKGDGHDEHRILYSIKPWEIERRERLNHGKECAVILRKVAE